MATIKMLKPNALISIEVGTGFVRRVHEMIGYLTADIPQEEVDKFYEVLKSGSQQFPEPWMDHFFTLTMLIGSIEQAADKAGMTYEESIPDVSTQQGG